MALVNGFLHGARVNPRLLEKVVTALVYLGNPYVQYFDHQAAGGWDDGIEVIEAVRLPGQSADRC